MYNENPAIVTGQKRSTDEENKDQKRGRNNNVRRRDRRPRLSVMSDYRKPHLNHLNIRLAVGDGASTSLYKRQSQTLPLQDKETPNPSLPQRGSVDADASLTA